MNYMTKWPEVFVTKDQTALTIDQHVFSKVVERDGSDWDVQLPYRLSMRSQESLPCSSCMAEIQGCQQCYTWNKQKPVLRLMQMDTKASWLLG